MPIYDADSDFARKRDQVKTEAQDKRDAELREAVDREPQRFVTPEEFLRQAAELGLSEDGK